MKKPTKTTDEPINITEIELTQAALYLVGETPLVLHSMSLKSRQMLIDPPPKKNAAERASTQKHEPFEEFRDAAYQFTTDDQPTRLYMPGAAFHSAMASAAIDMVGAKKAQIGRLTNVMEEMVCVWGVPKIICLTVRSADMKRTPDIHTLPILPNWCAKFTVEFVASLVKPASIGNLMGAAGKIIGVGDGRPEKGKLSFGKFRLVAENDPEFLSIQKFGGRKLQDAALANPAYYNLETERLLTWFKQSGRRVAKPATEHKPPRVHPAVAAAAEKKRRRGNGDVAAGEE